MYWLLGMCLPLRQAQAKEMTARRSQWVTAWQTPFEMQLSLPASLKFALPNPTMHDDLDWKMIMSEVPEIAR
jgi:hypothetical protein